MCKSTNIGAWQPPDAAVMSLFSAALVDRGLKLTRRRRLVCEVILGCPGHICAEHVLETIERQYPNAQMNKTTVYRNLDLLTELGLIVEHKCGDGPAQYESALRGWHSHLLCESCGELIDIDSALADSIEREVLDRHSFTIDPLRYPILGVCSSCRA